MRKYYSFLFYFILTLALGCSVTYLYHIATAPFPATPKSSTTVPATTETPTTTTPPTTPPQTTPPQPDLAALFPAYTVTATLKNAAAGLPKGYTGAVKYGKGGVFYRVLSPTGEAIRVEADNLTLSAPEDFQLPPVSKATVENLAKERHFESDTDYLVVCCLSRLETYLFKTSPDGWILEKRMDCSTGDLFHPTPTGNYQITTKFPAIGKAGEYTCPYALGFFGNYLFHSIPLAPDQSAPTDPRIGGRISNGCIRLRTEDARWLYQTIPLGTAVVIF